MDLWQSQVQLEQPQPRTIIQASEAPVRRAAFSLVQGGALKLRWRGGCKQTGGWRQHIPSQDGLNVTGSERTMAQEDGVYGNSELHGFAPWILEGTAVVDCWVYQPSCTVFIHLEFCLILSRYNEEYNYLWFENIREKLGLWRLRNMAHKSERKFWSTLKQTEVIKWRKSSSNLKDFALITKLWKFQKNP